MCFRCIKYKYRFSGKETTNQFLFLFCFHIWVNAFRGKLKMKSNRIFFSLYTGCSFFGRMEENILGKHYLNMECQICMYVCVLLRMKWTFKGNYPILCFREAMPRISLCLPPPLYTQKHIPYVSMNDWPVVRSGRMGYVQYTQRKKNTMMTIHVFVENSIK